MANDNDIWRPIDHKIKPPTKKQRRIANKYYRISKKIMKKRGSKYGNNTDCYVSNN